MASSSKARQHSEVQKETPLEKKSEREIRPGKKKSISSSHVIEGWGDQEGAKTLARVKLRGNKLGNRNIIIKLLFPPNAF